MSIQLNGNDDIKKEDFNSKKEEKAMANGKLSGKQWLGLLASIPVTTILSILIGLGALQEFKDQTKSALQQQNQQISIITSDVSSVKADINGIETSRFKASDGLSIWKEIGDIKAEIQRVKLQDPPKWLMDRLDKIDYKMDKIDDKLDGNRYIK